MVSTFGVMFAPNQAQAASEMLRVCKPGGKIGLASWTPQGYVGQMLKTEGSYVPPPPGLNPPPMWGTEGFINDHFAPHVQNVHLTTRQQVFRYPSAQYWLDIFRNYYGPMVKAFEALDEEKRQALSQDILQLVDQYNQSSDDTMVVPAEYLEVVIER